MSPFLGEVVGTMILIILGNGVVGGVLLKKSKVHSSDWIVIAMGWGLAVAMAVYAVGEISGAHLNPAVTVGLAMNGDFAWAEVPAYILAQMIGAFLGAIIVWIQYFPHWKATKEKDLKLAVFSTAPAIRHTPANLMSEIIGTFVFVLALIALGANEFTQGLKPLLVGFLIVSIGLSLGGTTGFAINPARDLGPRIAHFILPIAGKGHSDWQYAWIPVVGPIIGGLLAALFYKGTFGGHPSPAIWGLSIVLLASILIGFVTNKKGKRA